MSKAEASPSAYSMNNGFIGLAHQMNAVHGSIHISIAYPYPAPGIDGIGTFYGKPQRAGATCRLPVARAIYGILLGYRNGGSSNQPVIVIGIIGYRIALHGWLAIARSNGRSVGKSYIGIMRFPL